MKIEEIKFMDFEKSQSIPQVIYKYRDWQNPRHRTILQDKVVFMAAPSSFEDKMDCKIPERYDLLTSKDMFQMYLRSSQKDNPSWTRPQHELHAREWVRKSPMNDPRHILEVQRHALVEYDKRFGVLSLTAINNSVPMWDKYSAEGRGFCVGFKSTILFDHLGGGGEVFYYDELPIIHPNESYVVKHAKQVFSKERKWEFEQEYRTHKFWPLPVTNKHRKIAVSADAYAEIIFGDAMPQEDIVEVKEMCVRRNLQVSFRQALKKGESIEIEDHIE